jgi:DUF4097 and DUF4098 domain-containing protein YvlB
MRYSAILIFILLPVLAFGGTMTETRNLELASDGIETLVINCGAGSLKLKGVSGGKKILMAAQIEGENFSETEFKEYVQKNVKLSLNKQARNATLQADLNQPPKPDQDARINLKIEIPETINVDIIDGSGSISVDALNADLRIDDDTGSIKGSGSISVDALNADLRIDDDTGSIKIKNISGQVRVGDSSGSITIEEVTGNVIITDGSGSIGVLSVRGDLNVKDGSGRY